MLRVFPVRTWIWEILLEKLEDGYDGELQYGHMG